MKTGNPSITSFQIENGLLHDYAKNKFPSRLWAWDKALDFEHDGSTCYGYIANGEAILGLESGPMYKLKAGQFFSVNEPFAVVGGKGVIMERVGYDGVNLIGGPIEAEGRIKYADGCDYSCVLQPVKLGDPCLNVLYIPEATDQVPYTHPSMRICMVASGSGVCVTPYEKIALITGSVFIIHEEGKEATHNGITAVSGTHSFQTKDEPMIIVEYSPDSYFGISEKDRALLKKCKYVGR